MRPQHGVCQSLLCGRILASYIACSQNHSFGVTFLNLIKPYLPARIA